MMHKIKLIVTDYGSSYDDYYSNEILRAGITDWEEVSSEDLKFLKDNLYVISQTMKVSGNVYVIEQDSVPIIERITTAKEFIEKQRKQQELDAAERAKAKEEAALKRRLKKAAKDEAERLLLYNKLKEEFGDNPPST